MLPAIIASSPASTCTGAACCTVSQGTRWGTPSKPDALGSSHQTLGKCARAVGSSSDCCQLCRTTLGCTAWTWWRPNGGLVNEEQAGQCCLRRWKPLGRWADEDAVAGLVSRPCTENCRLPDFPGFEWPIAGDGSGLVTHASMSEVPWMQLLHRPRAAHFQSPPEPPLSVEEQLRRSNSTRQSSLQAHAPILPRAHRAERAAFGEAVRHTAATPARIAVCMAGQARTLLHAAVWRSALKNLLAAGKHDLYAVLGTGSEGCPKGCADLRAGGSGFSLQRNNDMDLAAPCQLERALRALQPVRVRLVLRDGVAPCGENFATLQLIGWSTCADLIPRGKYDFIFRTRPDVYWQAPIDLELLASQVRRRDVVITHNGPAPRILEPAPLAELVLRCMCVLLATDWHMLLPDEHWRMLATFHNVTCNPLCNRCKRCLFREVFDDYNEYCLLISHLAAHRTRQIESSHPADPRIFTFVSRAPWLNPLHHGKLTRWVRRPKTQPAGSRIVCQGPPVRCHYCGGRHARRCPGTVDLRLRRGRPTDEDRPGGDRALLRGSSGSSGSVLFVRMHEAFVNDTGRCGTGGVSAAGALAGAGHAVGL